MDKLTELTQIMLKLLVDWRILASIAIFLIIWILLRTIAHVGGTPRSLKSRFPAPKKKAVPELEEASNDQGGDTDESEPDDSDSKQ